MLLAKAIFWLACFLTIYPYAIYPILLRVGVRTRTINNGSISADAQNLPSVTIIVSARNEEAVIAEKINNALALDYPAERLKILIVSDSSTDDTDAIVTSLAEENPAVELLAIAERKGKTAGLNTALEHVDSELVVFTDANAIFQRDALKHLAGPFQDSTVGYVVGAQKYNSTDGQSAGENEGLYWRFELALKNAESDFYSVVGGDGAIYAIRRELFTPLAAEDINDFVNPLQIILRGYTGVFCPLAVAFEDPADSFDKEFNRKRRIVCRSWGALLRYGPRLGLFRFPKFAFMLISHKVLRWLSVCWIAIATLLNLVIVIASPSGLYFATLLLIVGSMVLAMLGYLMAQRRSGFSSMFAIPYYFYLANIAAILGVVDYARGNRYVVWDHVRSAA